MSIASCSIGACVDRPPASVSPATTSAKAAVAASGTVGASTAHVPYYLDPAEGCDLLQVQLFPDPVALMRHFIAHDNAGGFLSSTPLQDSVYACPGHLGGSDEFSTVRESVVEPLQLTDSIATVLVRSTLLGHMRQDSLAFHFEAERRPIVDTFKVVRTPYGWRVESPAAIGRVLAARSLTSGDSLVHILPSVRDSIAHELSRP
jgi:hypothetical protein